MKNLGGLSSKGLFFGLASVSEARQDISGSSGFSLAIADLNVVPGEFLGPSDRPGTQALCIHELTEIVMVGEDKDLVFAALQMVAPNLDGLNNGQ